MNDPYECCYAPPTACSDHQHSLIRASLGCSGRSLASRTKNGNGKERTCKEGFREHTAVTLIAIETQVNFAKVAKVFFLCVSDMLPECSQYFLNIFEASREHVLILILLNDVYSATWEYGRCSHHFKF